MKRQASKRRRHTQKSCRRKVRHAPPIKQARRLGAGYYRCPSCRGYHLRGLT